MCDPTTISLVHSAALGDTLLLAPLLRSLRARFSQASIAIVTRPAFGSLLTALGFTQTFHNAEDAAHTLWFADGTYSQPTAWSDCDLLLSAVSAGQDAWSRHARKHCSSAQIYYFQPRPPVGYPHHVTQYHLEQLAPLSLQTVPAIGDSPAFRKTGEVLIHPGSGGIQKCWQLESFKTVARSLQARDIPIRFILGEAELDRWRPSLINSLRQEFPCMVNLSLEELTRQLRAARLFLGNDSGVTHLAAAIGTPTLAIFGQSNPVQWSPIGSNVRILLGGRCPTTQTPLLDPELVANAAIDLLGLTSVQ